MYDMDTTDVGSESSGHETPPRYNDAEFEQLVRDKLMQVSHHNRRSSQFSEAGSSS